MGFKSKATKMNKAKKEARAPIKRDCQGHKWKGAATHITARTMPFAHTDSKRHRSQHKSQKLNSIWQQDPDGTFHQGVPQIEIGGPTK